MRSLSLPFTPPHPSTASIPPPSLPHPIRLIHFASLMTSSLSSLYCCSRLLPLPLRILITQTFAASIPSSWLHSDPAFIPSSARLLFSPFFPPFSFSLHFLQHHGSCRISHNSPWTHTRQLLCALSALVARPLWLKSKSFTSPSTGTPSPKHVHTAQCTLQHCVTA